MESKRLKNALAVLVLGFLLFASESAHSQSEKQITKALKVFFNKSHVKGIDLLKKYIYKSSYGPTIAGYDTWAQMEYIRYKSDEELLEEIEIEDLMEDGQEPDSSDYEALEELKQIPKKNFIIICRRITIEAPSGYADMYLRELLIDYDPDSSATEKTKSFIEKGQESLFDQDYELAELNYLKALDQDSLNYHAILGLGYTFYGKEDYDSALVFFTLAKNLHPTLIEPRLYMFDVLFEQESYHRAKQVILEALVIYPGFDVKSRYQQVLRVENKFMSEHRFRRPCFPNDMRVDDQPDVDGDWSTYRSAKKKISKYCNEDGIIEPNGDTEERYLEVYSFKKLLQKKEYDLPVYLKFGKKMMDEGYLECYLFISMYHVDLFPQVKDFLSFEENRAKTIEYIEEYLIEKRTSTN